MKIDNKYNDIINKLTACIDLLVEHMKDLSFISAAKSRRIGKKLNNYTKILVNNVDGINQYKTLLESKNNDYKWDAAMNLFPLFPQVCLTTMEQVFADCDDDFRKSNLRNVIDAYKKDLNDKNVFFERLRKIYETEDLKSLKLE